METIIQVRGLTRKFGDLAAVDHIDFEVHQGEVFGFLGPNGAGKTTTVRMLTGVIDPTEGTAIIQGHDICKEPLLSRSHIAVVPEEANVLMRAVGIDPHTNTAKLHGITRYKVLGGFKVVAPHFWSSFDNFPEKNKVQLLKCFSTELEKRMNNPPVWKNLKKSLKYQSLLVKIIYPLTKITGKIRELELPIKVDKELCIQCKLCQKECPVVAITVDDFPKIDKSKCIHCFHCVNICPKNAITSDIEKAIKIVEKNRRIVGIEIPQNHIY